MVYREVLEGNFKKRRDSDGQKFPDSKNLKILKIMNFSKKSESEVRTRRGRLIVIDLVKVVEILIIENDFFHHKIRFNSVQSQNYKL